MAELLWENIVGSKTIEDGGFVGDLLSLSLAHLEEARDNSQLTDEQVGEVYASTIATAINSGIAYEKERDLIEAKINNEELQGDVVAQDILVKKQQVETEKSQSALTARQVAKIEQDIDLAKYDTLVKKQQVETEKNRTSLTSRQVVKIEKEIENAFYDNNLKKQQVETAKNQTAVSSREIAKIEKEIEMISNNILLANRKMTVDENLAKSNISKAMYR